MGEASAVIVVSRHYPLVFKSLSHGLETTYEQ